LLEEGLDVRTYKLSKSGTNVELDASLPLLGCSNWKNDYRHLICGIFDVGSRFIVIVIVIVITHLLVIRALVTAVIAPGLVPLADISIGVSPTATGAGVLINAAAAAAALGPATGVLIIAATAAFGISTTLAGAAARSGSVSHCVRCMLCRFALGVSALHVHGIHGSSPFII
jgi:hypothetical protein